MDTVLLSHSEMEIELILNFLYLKSHLAISGPYIHV